MSIEPLCLECELWRKGKSHYDKRQLDSAVLYFNEALISAEISENKVYMAYSTLYLGLIEEKKKAYNEAVRKNMEAMVLFAELKDTVQQFHCKRNIALNYNGLGFYKTSLDYLNQAALLIKNLEDPSLHYLLNISIGRVYEEMSEYDLALERYQLAHKLAFENSLAKDINESLINIGNVFLARDQLDSAMDYYARAHEASTVAGDSLRVAYASNNLGQIYLQKGEWESAELYLIQALDLKQRHAQNRLPSTYNALANLYVSMKDYQKAYDFLNNAISQGKEQGDIEHLQESYEVLKNYYQQTGDYKKALYAMEMLDSLRTHRFNTEKLAVNKLKASYDVQERDEQIALQDVQLKQERLIRWVILGTTLILLVVAFVLYILFKTNLRLKKKNELLLKEQNHRVKNNLQMISSLLSLQSQSLPSSEAQGALSESQARINSVALLHRMLYEGEELGKVELVDYLKSLTEEIKYAVPRDLEIKYIMPPSLLVRIEIATSLGLIVNELMTNSVKHVPLGIELVVELELRLALDELQLSYHDNGPGIDQKQWEASTSFGNQLIRIQSQQLRGTYSIHPVDGFHFTLTFKKVN